MNIETMMSERRRIKEAIRFRCDAVAELLCKTLGYDDFSVSDVDHGSKSFTVVLLPVDVPSTLDVLDIEPAYRLQFSLLDKTDEELVQIFKHAARPGQTKGAA